MKKWIAIVLIEAFCICFCTKTEAQQEFFVEAITTEQGLSQGYIFDILQDRDGFLWVATKDGLNRYDGYNFDVFTNDVNDPWSISGNSINLLFEDSAGRIWAASENGGINIYDKESGRFHRIYHDPTNPSSLAANHVTTIVEDTSGYFILGIEEKEINMLRLEDSFFSEQIPPSIIRIPIPFSTNDNVSFTNILKGISKDSEGRVWVGGPNGTYLLNIQNAKLTMTIDDYSLETACPDDKGGIWMCGHQLNTLYYWNGKSGKHFTERFNAAIDLKLDDHENLWFVAPDSLYGISTKDWEQDSLSNQTVERTFYRWSTNGGYPLRSMTLDHSGIVWVGTNGTGLYKINPNRKIFSHFLPGISIRQISPISNNEHFLLSYSIEWYNQLGNQLKMDPVDKGQSSTVNDYLLKSKSGELWIRQPSNLDGQAKIKRYNPKTGSETYYTIDWHHNNTQPIIEAKDGTIWMAGYNDILATIDPLTGTVTSYELQKGSKIDINNPDLKIVTNKLSTALYEDQSGAIWVGSGRGMTKCIRPTNSIDDLTITKYQNIKGDQNSLNYNHVSAFLDDPSQPESFLWVCTKGGGLNKLDKKTGKFTSITKKDGLPDNVVYGILTDSENNIWGSTNKGVFCMSKVSDVQIGIESEYSFRNFSKTDGLQDEEFNTGAYAKFPDGRLAFGGVNGYNIFHPKEVLSTGYQGNTFITKVFINNNRIFPNDESGILKNKIEKSKSIKLTHLHDILTLEFATLDYNEPARNQYRYQLIGADDNWVEIGTQRSATFIHLPPKTYTFRVQGSNCQGIWNEKITELEIVVLPPWWQTWWAYLIYASMLLAAIIFYTRFSVNRAKLQQQLKFEKRESDRVKDLDALKTQLYINMTHEFRTPLTIILGMAKQVKENPKDHFSTGMNMIINNGQNLLSLVNKMLNLSKLESGKMKLDFSQGDVVVFLRHIVGSFQSYAVKKEIQIHFLPEVDNVMMDFDQDKLQQVISNLISNAFKFTPDGGHIYFSIDKKDEHLLIRVKDTGRGIAKEDQSKIFDRFYQTDNSSTRAYEGTGIGLALCKQLVTLMEGQISVESPPLGLRKGTEFRVNIPITQEALKLDFIPPVKTKEFTKTQDKSVVENPLPVINSSNGASQIRANVQQVLKDNSNNLILLVEDNEDIVAYIASVLIDYKLIVANNGQEGYELALEQIPDLIISDVMMPIMDGFELCSKVKTDDRTDHIPIIMLTARADIESKLEGLELGANAYLPKPFEKQELLLNIKNLFELRNKMQSRYLSVAGLTESIGPDYDQSEFVYSEDEFVLKVRETIETHLTDFNFSVEILAKELHLSHSQFGRKLNALTGLSPNQFIRNIRLKNAKELLKNPDLSITSVAYDSGFNDPSYFSRIFKRENGQSPNEWRKSKYDQI